MSDPALPPGFTLDQPQGDQSDSPPPPPPGFTPDTEDQPPASAAPEGSGFTDDQKRQILDYLPKAKDAADLERFSLELSAGKSRVGNAQAILDNLKKGHKPGDFGWTPPTLGKSATKPSDPLTMDHVRQAIGDALVNLVAPGLGSQINAATQTNGAKPLIEHIANAVAMDYGPEVGGVIDTILHGDTVARNTAHERAILEGDSEGHPVASLVGELGGVGANAMLGNEAGLANLGRGARLATTMGEGAVYGSGAAGPGNRAEGAGIGAVAAPVIGFAAKAPAALIDAGKSVLEGSPGLARRIIAKAIKEDANTPESVGTAISDAHGNDVPMALGDTGENMRGLLAASSRASGVGRTVVRDALEERQSQLADRVVSHIERDLGPISNPHQVADDLMTKARTEAAPIYDKLYSQAPLSSPAVDALVARPSMQKALRNAYRIAQEEGRDPEALGMRLGEDGNVQLDRGSPLTSAEAKKANPNRFETVDIPDEMDQLHVRTITTPNGRKIRFRGPIDITQRLRMMGGIKDAGGELSHIGLSNAPRRLDFGANEQFLGPLVNNERGRTLDDATHALWEEGYFPEFHSRPTTDDLLDRLGEEHKGTARYFGPSDTEELDNFYRARQDRFHLQAAADEGRPMAEDRTQPTGYEDLAKRQGPAVPGRQPVIGKTYSPQTLDYIKRGMDDVVEGYRDPTTGKLNLDTEGRAVNNTLRSYMGVVDQLYPDYAKARAAYAGPVKGVAAMNLGRKALNMTGDDLEARMRDMSPFEKQMAAVGARRAMAELVSSKGDTVDIVHALVGTGKKRAMLARLFGDRKQFQRFVDTLGQEKEGWRSFKQALLGSPTAANHQDDAALQTAALAADFATGGLPIATSIRYALKFGVGKLGEKSKQQIAALLSNTDPAAIRELATELRAKAEQRGLRVRKVNVAAGAIGKGAVVALPRQQ